MWVNVGTVVASVGSSGKRVSLTEIELLIMLMPL